MYINASKYACIISIKVRKFNEKHLESASNVFQLYR
jgi:hypothetical protein